MQQLNTEEVNFQKLFLMISELKNEANNSYGIFSENYQALIDGRENFGAVISQIDVMDRNKNKLSQGRQF
jgi:hypothetical protein